MPPVTAKVPGGAAATLSYTIPGDGLDVESVYAAIDASGAAGPVTAELVVRDQSGVVIATKTQRDTIPAAGTGSATWALRLTDDGAATAAGYATVQDEGVALPQETILDFVGAGVTASDDAAGTRTIVSIPGSGSGQLAELILSEASLVAAWPFNDASGNALDISGHGNHLAPVGTPTYGQPGPFPSSTDTSIRLAGTDGFNQTTHDQFQATTNLNIFNGSAPFTFEMLALLTDAAQSGAFFWYFGGGGDAVELTLGATNGVGPGSMPTFLRGSDTINSNLALSLSQWTHVACTYDGTTMRIYVAGQLISSAASAGITTTGTTGFYVGRIGPAGGSVLYLRSYIAWGALYSSALPAATILQHANTGITSSGSVSNVRTVTATYTALVSDQVLLATGTFTVTLPAASTAGGHIIIVKNKGVGTVTVGRTGGDTIDGAAANITMATTMETRGFVSDGSGWWIVGAYL